MKRPGWIDDGHWVQAYVGRWRCRVWRDRTRGCWSWEARRFQRIGGQHVSGEAKSKRLAKRIAAIVAGALGEGRIT